jgi:hypothetical protein
VTRTQPAPRAALRPGGLALLLASSLTLCALFPLALAAGAAAPAGQTAQAPVIIFVDPLHGDDAAAGDTRATALATVAAAWQRIPAGAPLTVPYSIYLAPGDYTEGNFPVYWEDRHGTPDAPITLQPAEGARSARLMGFVNLYNVEHLTFADLDFATAGDVFHCEQCRHVTLRGVRMDGRGDAHETVKVNQSQYITITASDIAGAYENAIDFVAVQHAWITGSRIHDGDDWCAYVKGGSAYIVVENNEIYDCGTGGFTAGQGTGFEYMTAPWLHYEAYAVRVVNNIIHDTDGAGLGVNGGYNVLLAYNTLYRTGARSHLLEFVFGLRTCDGNTAACAANLAAGGWGTAVTGAEQPIPNRNVYVYNNLIANPEGYQSQWQHLTVHGARTPAAGSHIPSPATADDNLVFAGNVIWNGPAGHPLGVGAGEGCGDDHPTCGAAEIVQANSINQVRPRFVDAAGGDWRLANAGELPAPRAIPAFAAWDGFTPQVPASALANSVDADSTGRLREGRDVAGALVAAAPRAQTPRLFLPFARCDD